MKIGFVISSKLTSLLAGAAVAILFSSSLVADGAIRPLDDNELAKIVGSWGKNCWPKGDACQSKARGCAVQGGNCAGPCDHPYQNWRCTWSIWASDDCASSPSRDCGSQNTGVCNYDLKCIFAYHVDCGSASDCHETE